MGIQALVDGRSAADDDVDDEGVEEEEEDEDEEEDEGEKKSSPLRQTLQSLVLAGNSNIDDRVLELLVELTRLRHLDLSFCFRVTSIKFHEFVKEKELESWRFEQDSRKSHKYYFS